MMKLRKILAILMALAMVLAACSAFADVKLGSGEGKDKNGAQGLGEIGGYVEEDKQEVDDKVVLIEKDLVAYNPDETYVYGPDIDYTYTIEAGTAGVSITDATTDHASGISSTTTTLAGITTGLKVNGTTGTTGTISFENTDILEAATSGAANKKYLSLDFSAVVFTQPGVYRYKITETEHTDAEYKAAGVTETTGTHIRYLDVYVMRSADFDTTHDGTSGHEFVAGDWRIYGYVCVYNDSTAIVDGDTNNAVKTNGFVSGTKDGSETITADEYYTYNLTVSKDLVGDNTMIDHQFPFEVAFDTATNSVTGTFQLIAEQDTSSKSTITTTTATVATGAATVNDPTPTTGTTAAIVKVGGAQVLSASNYKGKVADGDTTTGNTVGFIKYIGIPYQVIPSVTETNDNVGTTYTTTVKENGTAVDVSSVDGTGATLTNATASLPYNTTATRIVAIDASDVAKVANFADEFTNTLAVISPTGVVMRVAPYALMLIGGIALLVIAKKHRKHEEE